MTRLRTVSCQSPGWTRVRCGAGFRYVDATGSRLDQTDVERVKALVIPPAWRDVWICPDERGHLQAVGTDEAGRRQYLYHPAWRIKRDAEKFERVTEVAARLPGVRRKLRAHLEEATASRTAVLSTAVRLIDLGCFRIGSDSYAVDNGSFGLTTLERRHLSKDGAARVFTFVGKSGIEHVVRIEDAPVITMLDLISRNRRSDARLLSAKVGRRWEPLSAGEVNDHIRDLFGGVEVTAKDFRTWHATVIVASALASQERGATKTARARQVRAAIGQAAELLGNTPTVARSSYVDPRVLDLFESGTVIGPTRGQDALDRAVVRLLTT